MLSILGDAEKYNKNKIFAIAPMMDWTYFVDYSVEFIDYFVLME
jgi:hypothetical protein